MNYIKEVEKLLGYEIGEEFNVIYNTGEYSKFNPYRFTDNNLVDKDGDNSSDVLILLLTGYYTTEKIPFVPKMGEKFFLMGLGLNDRILNSLFGLIFAMTESENY